jgi:3-methyladenine DNA glycosylase/8-oxoguanine DNA glycosylase
LNGRRVSVLVEDLPCSTGFRLRAVPPYDFPLTVHKPAGWSLLTPFEIFEDDTLWTAMRTHSGKMFGLKLESVGTVEKPGVFCQMFYALAESDPLIRMLVKDLYGMRRTGRPDIFPSLILAVTLQMAPIKRSDQMMNLLIKNYGVKARFDGGEISYWPSPERIAKTEARELKEGCKLGYRGESLRSIAEAVRKGFPSLQQLEKLSPAEARAKLMELRGIGGYSADIVSPHPGFALDVWSAKIFNVLLFGEEAKSPRSIIPRLKRLAEERWGRWRGYVFTYVLNDLNNLSKRFNFDLTAL